MADTNGANLKEALEAQKLIKQFEEELASLETKRNTARARAQKEALKQQIDAHKTIIKNSKEYETYQKKINKDTETFGKSWTKLSSAVQKNLGGTNKNATVYSSIATKIITLEAKQAGLTGDELEANMELVSRLREQNDSLVSQAKMTATAEARARGMNDSAIRKRELEEEITKAIEERNDELREALELEKEGLELKDTLEQKENKLTSIAESQKDIMDALPDGLKNGIGFAKKFADTLKAGAGAAAGFMIFATIAIAALNTFTKLDEAAGEFAKETGITNTQMQGIRSDANEIVGEFSDLGVEAKNVFDTVAALKSEFSDVANFSKETTAALTVLTANMGVSAEAAAKVQSQFEAIGGLSSETAANVQLQVASMANLAGVAPKKVFEDIAENAEATSTFFKGDLTALTKNAIQARRLGSSLKEQVSLAEKLLDFESGIEEELVAATFVGGQFNLSQARGLAMAGKTAEAQEEVLRQIQRSGDFRKQDYFTQQQLAKASGMSVEQINKQLNAQEKLNSLTDEQKKAAQAAIDKGLDITNINADQLAQETEKFSKQQEQQQQLEQLNNAFAGIASTVGSVLTPLLSALIPIMKLILFPVQLIADGFKFLGENLQIAIPLAAGLAIAFGPAIIAAITSAVGFIMSSFAMIPLGLGIPLGIAAVAGLFSMVSKAKATSVGDVMSPADGKTQISTKEGGLYELSPNDDLVAAPGAASALEGAAGGTTKLVEGKSSTPNLAVLSAPLNAMINEIKALRADLNSGKIAVYMDTAKVTSNISSNVDQGTRNSFNMGSA